MVLNSVKKFLIFNETKTELKEELKHIKKILDRAIHTEKEENIYFNVILVDNKAIHEINKTYRNIDKPTDVISFALEDEKDYNIEGLRMLGDIYISIEQAEKQAESYGHSLQRELCFLAVHGFLHLLGYDHMNEKEERKMFEKQELILNEKR